MTTQQQMAKAANVSAFDYAMNHEAASQRILEPSGTFNKWLKRDCQFSKDFQLAMAIDEAFEAMFTACNQLATNNAGA